MNDTALADQIWSHALWEREPRYRTIALLVEGLPVAVAVVVNGDGGVRLALANRSMRDCLRRLGSAFWRTIDLAARGRHVGEGMTVAGLLVDETEARVVSWMPSHTEARRDLAAHRWGLTSRQTDVLVLLAEGQANKSIATILGLSEATIELHVTHLFNKTLLENRASLVAAYWRLV